MDNKIYNIFALLFICLFINAKFDSVSTPNISTSDQTSTQNTLQWVISLNIKIPSLDIS